MIFFFPFILPFILFMRKVAIVKPDLMDGLSPSACVQGMTTRIAVLERAHALFI